MARRPQGVVEALDRFFRLSEHHTHLRTEVLAGLTTFLTMAYIIFVQPAVLSGSMFGMATGMDFGAVTTATCLSAALASAVMALYARYPIAQAPGMGENFFFVFSAIPAAAAAGFTNSWEVALGAVFVSGVLFIALSTVGLRAKLIDAVSPSMKHGIAAGIGLFIAFIGLQNAGLILKDPGTAVRMNTRFASPDLLVFFTGLIVTTVLHARRVRGSLVWGIAAATLTALGLRWLVTELVPSALEAPLVRDSLLMTRFVVAERLFAQPPSLAPTFLKLDVLHALTVPMLPLVLMFLFMVLFDTIGTLIGVAQEAGLMQGNRLPRANQALLSDAIGTTLGACLGTSTVTSFIESAAGVEQGGRTGLTSLTTAGLFLLALFVSPVIAMVGSYAPVTAAALVLVGCMMSRHIGQIAWSDYSEAVPAFLILIGVPLSYSIADGLALGFIAYPLIKVLSGKAREVNGLMIGLAAVLIVYFVAVRSRMP